MQRACSKSDCDYASSGICLEGDEGSCKNLGLDEPETEDLKSLSEEYFHTGEKLTPEEASRLLNAIPARVILCAGTQDAGKTTFLARMCELFRKGVFKRYLFSKSLTLIGFERASWHATITSAGLRADTRRTSRQENDHFLHLQVRSISEGGKYTTLLISDLSGESYREVIASRAFCAEQLALARADVICLFLDSASLVNSRIRFSEHDNAIQFLTRVLEVSSNPRIPGVIVVFSRWDKLTTAPDSSSVEEYCEYIESDIITRFKGKFQFIEFQRISARPAEGRPTDDELMLTFHHWVACRPTFCMVSRARQSAPARDFCAFGL